MRIGGRPLGWSIEDLRVRWVSVAAVGALAIVLVVAVIASRDAVNRRKRQSARIELWELRQHLRRYYVDFGYYPSTDQGLDFLFGSEEIDAGIFRGTGPHLRLPRDPWGRPFVYESDGNSYILKSLGPGGAGGDRDLTTSGGPE